MSEPWIEKYRPKNINDIVLSDVNRQILNNMINNDFYPNLILYGPPGTGKTTTILCLMNHYCDKHICKNNYIHLNASHERGIDVIRNEIFEFTEKTNIFNNCQKFILLDEIDSMTKHAQNNLQTIVTNSKSNITFILICNYLNRIVEYFRRTFTILYFNKTSSLCNLFIEKCIDSENISIPQKKLNIIKKMNYHDLRSIINSIQNYNKYDLMFDEKLFNKIITNNIEQNKRILTILIKQIDIKTFYLFIFNSIQEKYQLDYTTTYYMKLLLTINNDFHFFYQEFIPYIKKNIII